jgi:hypothetical protein
MLDTHFGVGHASSSVLGFLPLGIASVSSAFLETFSGTRGSGFFVSGKLLVILQPAES